MMPRYLFEAGAIDGARRDRAARLAAQRFPELGIEHGYLVHEDGRGSREVWVCRAPSEAHLRRWAAAAGITLETVQLVGGDLAPPHGSERP